jgi:hypothetical protein
MRHHRTGIVLSLILLAVQCGISKAQCPYVVYYSYPTCPVTYAPAPAPQAPAASCCPSSCCSSCCCQRPDNSGGGSGNNSNNNSNGNGENGNGGNGNGGNGNGENGGPNETNGGSSRVESRGTTARFALSRTVSAKFSVPKSVPISGLWHSKFGTIDLSHNGKDVTGFIRYKHGGNIDVHGRYELGMLTLLYQHRSQPDIRGTVALHYDSVTGHFAGESKNIATGRETNWILSR